MSCQFQTQVPWTEFYSRISISHLLVALDYAFVLGRTALFWDCLGDGDAVASLKCWHYKQR